MIETDAPWCEIRPTHASSKYINQMNIIPSVKKEKWKAGVMVKGRNEPCNIRHVLDVIAGIKSGEGSTEEFRNDLADQIYHNTKNVFFSSIVEN